jgi:NAD(P) transhydrogenase subunit alpha
VTNRSTAIALLVVLVVTAAAIGQTNRSALKGKETPQSSGTKSNPLAPSDVSPSDALPDDLGSLPTTTSKKPIEPVEYVDYWSLVFVFVLSAFIGLGVIGRVSRLLHTPLMSLTNAISAIAVVGSIVVTGSEHYSLPIRVLGAIALFASMTNIVSGFLITDRMLRMFKQTRPVKP